MPIQITSLNTIFQQFFDTLINTAGTTTNTLLPDGWTFNEVGGGARDNEQYGVDTGASTTGDTYSYGTAGSTDRALGSLLSGTLNSTFGASFTNSTGSTITSLLIEYIGEQWRLGTAGRTDRLDFQISFDATDLTTGTWTDIDALDFVTPFTTTTGARDGNAAINRTALSHNLTGLNIADGATFWIRWVDNNATGSDDGLAIDDFQITAQSAPTGAGNLDINSASIAEGDSGTTNITFTVTRSGGSSGAVSATWTATFGAGAGNADAADFVGGQLFTGTVNFADGETSQTITLAIAGDTISELNEAFTVTLSAPTGGAAITTASGTGTIQNDDAAPGTLSIASASVTEGNSGTAPISFTVTRADGSDGAVTATWTATFGAGATAADAGDFASGQAFTGTVSFAAGETSQVITLNVQGDTDTEQTETFTVTLSAPTGGAALGTAAATGTITSDDVMPANVFINEIHYDNSGADANEAIEIAGRAGTDLTGYSLVLYNGSNTPGAAVVYATINLSGVIDDEGAGYGALSFAATGIQNGVADGIALIGPGGTVVQFLSYEGVLTAAAGTPAGGLTSTDIGVSEDGSGTSAQSMQLIGNGAAGTDFTWVAQATNSFGSLNSGQTIIPDNGTGLISVADSAVAEGNSGTTNLVFTVERAGGLGTAATVDYTITLNGTADASDLDPGAVLTGTVTFAAGAATATITVPVLGDAIGEGNETLSLTLSNPVGNVTISDASATGTITNDDPIALTIMEIQGAGHQSSYNGQPVTTTGIVTAVDTNGYYLQDPTGDGNTATSDAIFVFTSTAPTVAVGDSVSVSGSVTEFFGSAGSLSLTQITSPTTTVLSSGNALPAAVLIGTGGLLPPTAVYEDDGFTIFDPANDALDFYETLEGMRVTVAAPQVVGDTNGFGETWVVASGGAGATTLSARGGINISAGDLNPERIQIDDDPGIFAGFVPAYTQGDVLSNVTGIFNYAFNSYELLVTEAVTITQDVTLTRETTAIQGDATHITIATYNLENLDPTDTKFNLLASDIVFNLGAPDIIAVQEIQDADGAGTGSNLSGTVTAQALIDAITAAGGPTYAYVEVAPSTANTTGGEPNGNIRNGYFYNTSRVSYITGSATLLSDAAFNGSRSPLVAAFEFNGMTINLINMHSTSRGGSDPLFGAQQPPADAGDAARTAQATAVRAYIDSQLATNSNLAFAVMGDFNGFTFENAIGALTAGNVLTDLNTLLPAEERYSYFFEGNLQQLDHILVTGGLYAGAQCDAVHINAEFSASTTRPTDHDPQVARLFLAPIYTGDGTQNSFTAYNSADWTIYGNAGDDTLGGASGDDTIYGGDNNDTLSGNGGADKLYGDAGNDILILNATNGGSTIDGGAGTDTLRLIGGTVTLADVTGIEAIELAGGATLAMTSAMYKNGLASNVSISGTGTLDITMTGSNLFYATGQPILAGSNISYIIRGGDTQTNVVKANLNAVNTIIGGSLNDQIRGGNLGDTIDGGAGDDKIMGVGGADLLTGGLGADQFRYLFASDSNSATGIDQILDFVAGTDKLDFRLFDADPATAGYQGLTYIGTSAFATDGSAQVRWTVVGGDIQVEVDANGDGTADMQILLTGAGAQTLNASDFMLVI